jgi:methylmalonyl-CoA mutase
MHSSNRHGDAPESARKALIIGTQSPAFEVRMDAVRVCSLGRITRAPFEVGGQYRRSM